MPNISNFGTQTDNAVVSGTLTDRNMAIPDVPPQGLMSIGPRVTPNFVKPREWSALTTYHFFDAVRSVDGNAYVATKPVIPAGTPLEDEDYWFLWADPDTRFDDLNETVKTFDLRIKQNATAIEQETQRAREAEATKAPINHAIEESTYGVGNASNYGHLKLATDETPLTSDSDSGIAATPKLVKNLKDDYVTNKKIMLAIGDSFTATSYTATTGVWASYVANALNIDYRNYAIAGKGFIAGSESEKYAGQLQTASDDEAFDNDNVAYVFICGCLNDLVYEGVTATSLIAAVESTVTLARNLFKNAKVIVAGPNTWNNFNLKGDGSVPSISNSNISTYFANDALSVGAFNSGAVFVSTMWMGVGTNRYTNNGHPDALLQKNLASIILQQAFGFNPTYNLFYAYFSEDLDTQDENATATLSMVKNIGSLPGVVFTLIVRTKSGFDGKTLSLTMPHGLNFYTKTNQVITCDTDAKRMYIDTQSYDNTSKILIPGLTAGRIYQGSFNA